MALLNRKGNKKKITETEYGISRKKDIGFYIYSRILVIIT
ncbi:unnamed protein product, partial [marine sediment metagenome]